MYQATTSIFFILLFLYHVKCINFYNSSFYFSGELRLIEQQKGQLNSEEFQLTVMKLTHVAFVFNSLAKTSHMTSATRPLGNATLSCTWKGRLKHLKNSIPWKHSPLMASNCQLLGPILYVLKHIANGL